MDENRDGVIDGRLFLEESDTRLILGVLDSLPPWRPAASHGRTARKARSRFCSL